VELRRKRADAELRRKIEEGTTGLAMLVELSGDQPLALLSALQGVEALCLRHCKDIDVLLPTLREIDAIRGGFAHE
jgi:hypothetical protein